MRMVFFCALLLAALSAPAQSQTIRIGTEAAYAPWNFIGLDGELAGFEIELAGKLCAYAQITCEFSINAWGTIIQHLNEGEYDAIMAGMAVTQERQEQIDFSQDYYPSDLSRFVARRGFELSSEEIAGTKIGVQSATIHAVYVAEKLAANNEIAVFETAALAMAGLFDGSVDLVLADYTYLEPITGGSNGVLKFIGPEVYVGNGVAIGLRKGDDALREKLDKALFDLKSDGVLDKLIRKWFGKGPFYSQCSIFAC